MKMENVRINKEDIMAGVREKVIVHNDRMASLYPTIFNYLNKKIDGWNPSDFFREIGVRRIALYAVSDLTRLLVRDLNNHPGQVEFILADTNYHMYMHEIGGHKVYGMEELLRLYHAGQVEKIIPCVLFSANVIIDNLIAGGVRLEDIISINDVF